MKVIRMITAAVMLSLTTAVKIEGWNTPGGGTSAQFASAANAAGIATY